MANTVTCFYEARPHPLNEDDRPCKNPRVVVDPCSDCGGWGGTCILIHDGSPHGRDSCRTAQWRACSTCNGTGAA